MISGGQTGVETTTWGSGKTALRLLRAGKGPPLLYLHGAGDIGRWLPVLDLLARDVSVLRPDHPGFSGSPDLDTNTPAEIARVYARLLDRADLQEAILFGSSLGGWIAAELALRCAPRIARLVLVAPAGLRPNPSLTLTRTEDDPRIRTERDRAWLERNIAEAARLIAPPREHDPGLGSRLRDLEVPTHVVWGAEDPTIPVDQADAWSSTLPHATVDVLADRGHLPHVEDPATFLMTTDLTPAPRARNGPR